MNSPPATTELPLLNPFATRAIRAGAIPYWDPEQQLPQIERRFEQAGYRGAIVGPHGSGKTSLLASLAERWLNRFAAVRWLTILRTTAGLQFRETPPRPHRATDPPPGRVKQGWEKLSARQAAAEPRPTALWIVDGFDALAWRDRLGLTHFCRRHQIALVATSHQPTNLPTLFRTTPTLTSFLHLADRLQRDRADRLEPTELEGCYRAAGGNFREAFFLAFDKYRAKRGRSQ